MNEIFRNNSTNCQHLCFLPTEMVTYLRENPNRLSNWNDWAMLKLIFSELHIKNCLFAGQKRIFTSYVGVIEMSGNTIRDTSIDYNMIIMSNTNINLIDTYVTNITQTRIWINLFYCSIDSVMNVTDFLFENSQMNSFTMRSSKFISKNVTFRNINSRSRAIVFQEMTDIIMENWDFNNVRVGRGLAIYAYDSYFSLMRNITLHNVRNHVFVITNSKIELAEYLTFSTCFRQCSRFVDSEVTIKNSEFKDNRVTWANFGAILNLRSNVTLVDSTISNNYYRRGTGILIRCITATYCVNNLTNVHFLNNQARTEGGAIYYDSFRPIMNNVTFTNNRAPYGPNIASYPVRTILVDGTSASFSIDNVPSGQVYDQQLSFRLVDYDNQTIQSQTSGLMSITAVSPEARALGFSTSPVVGGVSTFKDVVFQAAPGSQNVEFSVKAFSIDPALVLKVFGVNTLQEPFFVNFRYCKPGESEEGDICFPCTSGSYTLEWNSTGCQPCMDHADCLGGTEIHVDPRYWRSSTNSSAMIECLRKDACLGGYEPEKDFPVNCEAGYEGILCTD